MLQLPKPAGWTWPQDLGADEMVHLDYAVDHTTVEADTIVLYVRVIGWIRSSAREDAAGGAELSPQRRRSPVPVFTPLCRDR